LLEEGSWEPDQEQEAEIGEHMSLARGRDVFVEEKLVDEREDVKEDVKDVKGKLVKEQQNHAEEHVKDVEEHIVRALCCMAVATGRLDTALVQEDCRPVGGDCRLWEDALDWWRICG
jgi:hypothetical protein